MLPYLETFQQKALIIDILLRLRMSTSAYAYALVNTRLKNLLETRENVGLQSSQFLQINVSIFRKKSKIHNLNKRG